MKMTDCFKDSILVLSVTRSFCKYAEQHHPWVPHESDTLSNRPTGNISPATLMALLYGKGAVLGFHLLLTLYVRLAP